MFPGKFGSLDVVARFLDVSLEDAKKVIADQKISAKKFAGKETYSMDEAKAYANKQDEVLVGMQEVHKAKVEKAGRVALSEKAVKKEVKPEPVKEITPEVEEAFVEESAQVAKEVEEGTESVQPRKRRTAKPKVVTKK